MTQMQNQLFGFQVGFPRSWLISGTMASYEMMLSVRRTTAWSAAMPDWSYLTTDDFSYTGAKQMENVWSVTTRLEYHPDIHDFTNRRSFVALANVNFSTYIFSFYLFYISVCPHLLLNTSASKCLEPLKEMSTNQSTWQNTVMYLCSWIFPTADGCLKTSLSDGDCHTLASSGNKIWWTSKGGGNQLPSINTNDLRNARKS